MNPRTWSRKTCIVMYVRIGYYDLIKDIWIILEICNIMILSLWYLWYDEYLWYLWYDTDIVIFVIWITFMILLWHLWYLWYDSDVGDSDMMNNCDIIVIFCGVCDICVNLLILWYINSTLWSGFVKSELIKRNLRWGLTNPDVNFSHLDLRYIKFWVQVR